MTSSIFEQKLEYLCNKRRYSETLNAILALFVMFYIIGTSKFYLPLFFGLTPFLTRECVHDMTNNRINICPGFNSFPYNVLSKKIYTPTPHRRDF